jgi:hypothetical protein
MRKTVVFAASSNPKIASVGPVYVDVDALSGGIGTATFTVTPHAAGSANVGPPTITGLNAPTGVAVDAAGKIYVVNNSSSTVTTYNPDGSVSSPTIATGLNSPWGIAVR